jgi:P-type conjugative transfer protein TrbJ
MTPQQIGQQFGMWQTTLGNASNSLARTLGVQQGQEQNYAALQAAMQVHSQTAVGQMQAIQAGNELAGLANTQLQQIQTTLTVYAQDQTNRGLVADDRQAAHDAADLQFFQYQPIATTGSQGF